MITRFLDEVLRLGYTGKANAIVAARDAGRRYLRDRLLPAWWVNDTWGRYFWDWEDPVQSCLITSEVARYLLDHQAEFPNWGYDARNILTLFLNRTSVSPASNGDVYSGAWAYPESSGCCDRSLWYSPMIHAPAFAQYAVETGDAWMRELALPPDGAANLRHPRDGRDRGQHRRRHPRQRRVVQHRPSAAAAVRARRHRLAAGRSGREPREPHRPLDGGGELGELRRRPHRIHHLRRAGEHHRSAAPGVCAADGDGRWAEAGAAGRQRRERILGEDSSRMATPSSPSATMARRRLSSLATTRNRRSRVRRWRTSSRAIKSV